MYDFAFSDRLSKDFARKKQELSKRDSQRSSAGQQQMQKGASSVVSPANMDFLQGELFIPQIFFGRLNLKNVP